MSRRPIIEGRRHSARLNSPQACLRGICFVALILLLPFSARGEKRLFIIDDDNGMDKKGCARDRKLRPSQPWLPVCDPDGGLQLVYALRDPEIEVIGITCSAGCSSLRVCVDADKKLLKLLGREDVPVLAGASGPKDLGKSTEASKFIIDQVMSRPGQIEILATAPLTNLATAMMAEPALANNWKTLHFATGEFHGALGVRSDARFWEWSGYRDMNINVDSAATRYVVEHGGAFPIYPNEVMDDVELTLSEWRSLRKSDSELGGYLADQCSIMVKVEGTVGRLLGLKGMTLHGIIGAALAFHPELFTGQTIISPIKVVQTKKNGDIFELSSETGLETHAINWQFKDAQLFKQQYLDRFR